MSRELTTVFDGAKYFALECKMLSNPAEVREEALCPLEIPEAAHAALPLSCRLMAIFGAGYCHVVEAFG